MLAFCHGRLESRTHVAIDDRLCEDRQLKPLVGIGINDSTQLCLYFEDSTRAGSTGGSDPDIFSHNDLGEKLVGNEFCEFFGRGVIDDSRLEKCGTSIHNCWLRFWNIRRRCYVDVLTSPIHLPLF